MNEKSIRDILDVRQSTHGDYDEWSTIWGDFFDLIMLSRNWTALTANQKASTLMIANKLARILAGDPNERDHWVDIAGYATLTADRLPAKVVTSKELVDAAMDIATRQASVKSSEHIVPRSRSGLTIDSPAVDPKYRGPRHAVAVPNSTTTEERPPWLRPGISIPITIAQRWYHRVGHALYTLEPWVVYEGDGDEPPPELKGFYTYHNPPGAEVWLLEIANCPPDVRENYYSKYVYRDKLTPAEFGELLTWERGLYELSGDRYQLKPTMQAWGRG